MTPPTVLPDIDANDALLLNAFQQQFSAEQEQQQRTSINLTDISLLDCDPTPIGTMNFNGSSSQQANSQQLFELMQAMSAREQSSGGGFNSNGAANTNLLQQQLRQQQQQQSFNANNAIQNQNQQNLQSQLANLLGNQQQQQASQRHSLSLANLDFAPQQQQRQHSLSLGTSHRNSITGAGNVNALLALQLSQQQQPRTNNVANNATKPSAVSKKQQKDFLLFIKILLKCLGATQNNVLKERTKAIVSECTKRNRLGDPAYSPLQTAVEQRLRPIVGEHYWTRAQNYVRSYHTKQPQLAQRAAQLRQQQRQQQQLMRMAARC